MTVRDFQQIFIPFIILMALGYCVGSIIEYLYNNLSIQVLWGN